MEKDLAFQITLYLHKIRPCLAYTCRFHSRSQKCLDGTGRRQEIANDFSLKLQKLKVLVILKGQDHIISNCGQADHIPGTLLTIYHH